MKRLRKASILWLLGLLTMAMCSSVVFAEEGAGNQSGEGTLLSIYLGLIAVSVLIVMGVGIYYVKRKKE